MPDQPAPNILIVDDEAPQMMALCNTLRDEGYATTGFASPHQALTALRSRRFDLILTDLMMPEMDGITLLQTALDIDPELVGIVMTGHGTIDTAVRAMKIGALDYVLKPFDLTVVLPVLARALTIRRLRLENDALQKKVRDHAAQLEAANRELEAFSYSVSHDLRAPLRAINGFTQILQHESNSRFNEREKLLLEKVCSSATHMGHLIDALLNLSRLGRQKLAREAVDLPALVNQVLTDLSKEHGERSVEIRVAQLPSCIGDPTLLRQAFANLLANAFKFTRSREKAAVEVGHLKENGENIYFVRDNGAGFDMRYVNKLFGAFQRLHSQEEFEGTGIGLSVVQRIIHRHGGKIWAEGEPDKGATFFFTLPAT